MENLASPYECLVEIRASLQLGDSLRTSLRQYFADKTGRFPEELGQWFLQIEQGLEVDPPVELVKNSYRLALLAVFKSGLQGQPIYDYLCQLEDEMHLACVDEIEDAIRMQPLHLLFPLMLLQFPAFMILLFGPVLNQLIGVLG